jgi:hypothetical protein
MTRPLTQPEKLIFGEDAEVHSITDLPLQRGHGAASPDEQAVGWHLDVLKHQRAETASRIGDLDRAIEATNGNAAQLEFLQRHRIGAGLNLEQLNKRIRDVEVGLLASGAIERVRDQAFADEMRARLGLVADPAEQPGLHAKSTKRLPSLNLVEQ